MCGSLQPRATSTPRGCLQGSRNPLFAMSSGSGSGAGSDGSDAGFLKKTKPESGPAARLEFEPKEPEGVVFRHIDFEEGGTLTHCSRDDGGLMNIKFGSDGVVMVEKCDSSGK